jgi:hypothetical protein
VHGSCDQPAAGDCARLCGGASRGGSDSPGQVELSHQALILRVLRDRRRSSASLDGASIINVGSGGAGGLGGGGGGASSDQAGTSAAIIKATESL